MTSAQPLQVLVLVDHAVGVTGPHRNVVGSLNALTKRDSVRVRLLTSAVDDAEPYTENGRIDLQLGYHPHDPSRLLANLRAVHRAAAGCDVIYVPTNLKSLLYAQSARAGKRLVAGPNVTHLPIRKADSPGTIELCMMCDVWLEASDARRSYVANSSGRPEKLRRIHHAIDSARFSPKKRSPEIWDRYGVSRDTLKVLYVGRDCALKGVSQLLDAIRLLSGESKLNKVDFILVGEMTSATIQQATELPNVKLLGFQRGEELAAIYASSDLSIVPSSWEGFGFTVLEAMASGLAVIGSNTGGIAEQIAHRESGILLDLVGDVGCHRPDAAVILARAIQDLVQDDTLRVELGRGARRRALEHFSEARLGCELEEVFRG